MTDATSVVANNTSAPLAVCLAIFVLAFFSLIAVVIVLVYKLTSARKELAQCRNCNYSQLERLPQVKNETLANINTNVYVDKHYINFGTAHACMMNWYCLYRFAGHMTRQSTAVLRKKDNVASERKR